MPQKTSRRELLQMGLAAPAVVATSVGTSVAVAAEAASPRWEELRAEIDELLRIAPHVLADESRDPQAWLSAPTVRWPQANLAWLSRGDGEAEPRIPQIHKQFLAANEDWPRWADIFDQLRRRLCDEAWQKLVVSEKAHAKGDDERPYRLEQVQRILTPSYVWDELCPPTPWVTAQLLVTVVSDIWGEASRWAEKYAIDAQDGKQWRLFSPIMHCYFKRQYHMREFCCSLAFVRS